MIHKEILQSLQYEWSVETFSLSSSICEVPKYNTIAVGSYEGRIQIFDV